jgi:hypothetical protein
MKSTLSVFVAILFACGNVQATEPTVALGRALSNTYAKVEEPCPEGWICMNSWYRYRVKIQKSLVGPTASGTVTAVAMQHTQRRLRKGVVSLFVLTAIESVEERKRLGADFIIGEFASPETIYCVGKGAEKYGFHNLDKRGLTSIDRPDSVCVRAEELD